MHYFVTTDALATLDSDCLVVPVHTDGTLPALAAQLDRDSGGVIRRVIDSGDFSGKAGQTQFLHGVTDISSPRILLVGFGSQDKPGENDFNTATNAMARALNESGAQSAVCCI